MSRVKNSGNVVVILAFLGMGLGTVADARRQPPAEMGPILWGPAKAGMSRREVQRAVHRKFIQLTDLCTGTFQPTFALNRLTRVTLSGGAPRNAKLSCADRVQKTLEEKYGKSDANLVRSLESGDWQNQTGSPLIGLVKNVDPNKYSIEAWSLPDISILFLASKAKFTWSATYAANPRPISTDHF